MNPTPPSQRRPQRIAVLPGDGTGKDVTAEAVKVLEAAAEAWDLPLELVHLDWDADRYLATGETMPAGALDDFRENYSAIFIGAYGDPRVPDMKHAADILLGIRFGLDLYINLRPIKLYDPRLCPLNDRTEKDVDMVIFRENTEGAYVGMGGIFKKGTPDEIAMQEEVNTRKGVERIVRYAYAYAQQHGFKRVCMADKSNVMTYGHDLWQRVFAEVRAGYPQMESTHLYVDALAMFLVKEPARFQVIVTNNMFGDILADLGAALQGGMGMAASGNINPEQGPSLFEPVHGSAPPLAGKNVANPIGAVLSAAMMAAHIGLADAARLVEDAVAAAVRERQCTADVGGSLGTREAGEWIASWIARK